MVTTPKGKENICSHKNLYTDIPSSKVLDKENLEMIQMPEEVVNKN